MIRKIFYGLAVVFYLAILTIGTWNLYGRIATHNLGIEGIAIYFFMLVGLVVVAMIGSFIGEGGDERLKNFALIIRKIELYIILVFIAVPFMDGFLRGVLGLY